MPGVRRKPKMEKVIICPRCGSKSSVYNDLSKWRHFTGTGVLCPCCAAQFSMITEQFMEEGRHEAIRNNVSGEAAGEDS